MMHTLNPNSTIDSLLHIYSTVNSCFIHNIVYGEKAESKMSQQETKSLVTRK